MLVYFFSSVCRNKNNEEIFSYWIGMLHQYITSFIFKVNVPDLVFKIFYAFCIFLSRLWPQVFSTKKRINSTLNFLLEQTNKIYSNIPTLVKDSLQHKNCFSVLQYTRKTQLSVSFNGLLKSVWIYLTIKWKYKVSHYLDITKRIKFNWIFPFLCLKLS